MKRICLFICLAGMLALTGCGNSNTSGKVSSNRTTGVNEVLEQGKAEADGRAAEAGSQPAEAETKAIETDSKTTEAADKASASASDNIDVDLTALSSTMVYSEVFNMVTTPDKYMGKTVKMKGPFAYYYDEAADKYYFACIIQDATACCAQGMEFVLTDDYTYPDDYPEVDEEIQVVGVFDTYQEGDMTYCTLRNAKLV